MCRHKVYQMYKISLFAIEEDTFFVWPLMAYPTDVKHETSEFCGNVFQWEADI